MAAGAVLGGGSPAAAVGGPGGSQADLPMTFEAYVQVGETIGAFAGRQTVGTTLTITDPTGAVIYNCTWNGGSSFTPAGCSTAPASNTVSPDIPATATGVYGITYTNPANANVLWSVFVEAAGIEIPGRVWTNEYKMNQVRSASDTASFSLWYQSQAGYLYKADYATYTGINSVFSADATGVHDSDDADCVSAYRSMDLGGPNFDPTLGRTPLGSCGDPFKIFFQAPAADLPATAQSWDGSTEWIVQAILTPSVPALNFTPNPATSRQDGEISWTVDDFTGNMDLQIDANNDGDFTDPEDRTIRVFGAEGQTLSYQFDGLDGLGNPIPDSAVIGIRAAISKVGEIHLVGTDVERRTDITVTAVNGTNAGGTTIYWDDTDLVAAGRACATPVTDGTAGVDSAGAGTHGWTCTNNANNGVNGSWGDARNIDDWTFAPSDVERTITVQTAPGISLEKSGSLSDGDGDGAADAGETVTYSFVVTNTGDQTLQNVTVTDPKVGQVDCPAGEVLPGASVTCTAAAPYTVTQADVDAGRVHNDATASGTNLSGAPVTAEDSFDVPTDSAAGIELAKNGTVGDTDGDATADVGETVTYSFQVTNTGRVTLDPVTVTDPKIGAVNCPAGPLAPAAVVTCTAAAPYTVTQADVDSGAVHNVATAHGTPPTGPEVTDDDELDLPTPQAAALSIVKSASPASVNAAGQSVAYTFLVTNTGDVTVTDLTVTDTMVAPAGPNPTVTCPTTTLAPDASVTCTATYTAAQADIGHGTIDNTATASGTDPAGQPVNSPESTASVPVDQAPALTIAKSASPASVSAAGETVTYSFLVTNTGNGTVSDLTVTDTMVAPAGPNPTVTCPDQTLAAGEQVTCTATYTATQADIENGTIDNSAVASGTDPNGRPVESDPSTATVTATRTLGLSIVKSADPASVSSVGQQITYTFAVRNTGNVTMTDIAVGDTFLPPAGPALQVVCPSTMLAAGQSQNCTATYRVTQADLDSGSIDNTATVSGTGPDGRRITSQPSTTSVEATAPPTGRLTLTKTHKVVDVNHNGKTDKGDRITWKITIRNTGTVAVTGIAVSDPSAGPVTCPQTTLQPGESMRCKVAAHTITKADVKKGKVVNVAIATGTTPAGPVTSGPVKDTVKVGGGYYGGPGRPGDADAEPAAAADSEPAEVD